MVITTGLKQRPGSNAGKAGHNPGEMQSGSKGGHKMDKVKFTQIEMLKKRAADALKAMWDAEAKGDHELSRWHWDRFVKAMASTRELKESREYRYGRKK